MPELPEVETVRRQLDRRLRGAKITQVDIWKTGRERPAQNRFVDALLGRTIERIERRAKLLIWRFTNGEAMIGHLKMTGRFVFVEQDYKPGKHDRILFVHKTKKGIESLVWSDIRQFGFLQMVSARELEEVLAKYGPEPLEATPDQLAERLIRPKTRTVKTALLNQVVIAGIGNIYADEACHRAGIRPDRHLGSLNEADRRHLATHIQAVLHESLAQKGTSAHDYVDTKGGKGGFLSFLRVYGHEGDPCPRCAKPIQRIVLHQRGTHFCASCQR